MTLEEFVLTYKDDNGNIKITIADYYERFIKPLDSRFKNSSFFTDRTVICCFKNHQDINPSLGTMNHRFLKGVKVYHCFGCGATGTVIRLHQRIQKEYYGRVLSDSQSALELCKLYGIDASVYDKVDNKEMSGYVSRMEKTYTLLDTYTLKDFSEDLLKVRKTPNLDIDSRASKINSAMIKYISTNKKLFTD